MRQSVDEGELLAVTSRSVPDHDDSFVVGVDFGTLSGRALVVRGSDGEELGSAVHEYAHGVIDAALPRSGEKLPDSWALQEPADWLEVLATAVPAAVQAAGLDPARIVGIATAFTASTPLPVLRDGTPLCRLVEFERRPHAYPKLWKHHAAQEQADRITHGRGGEARAVARTLRRSDLLGMGVRQGPAGAGGGS